MVSVSHQIFYIFPQSELLYNMTGGCQIRIEILKLVAKGEFMFYLLITQLGKTV
jgi:hypothetical protein